MDEYKECLSLGASEMGWDYQLAAIRGIATNTILEKMDATDALTPLAEKKEKYDSQLETLMNWGHIMMTHERDKKSSKSSNMDVGGMAGKDGWEEYERALNVIKGKGKGQWNWNYKGKGRGSKGFGNGCDKGKGKDSENSAKDRKDLENQERDRDHHSMEIATTVG